MLYIISGVPRSGKSTLARKIFTEKNIPYFPIDAFTSCLEECAPELGIFHGQTYAEEFEKISPIMKSLFTNLSQEEDSYIVEGDGILPHSLKSFQETLGKESVRICYLGYDSESKEKKLENIRTHAISKDDWTTRYSDEQLLVIVEGMIERSSFIKEECQKNGIAYFDVSNNFENAQEHALDYLLNDR